MGLWSISFLEAWGRRENELRFLWGTEQLSLIEEPRQQFNGVLESNPETGRTTVEQSSAAAYYIKQTVANLLCIAFILFTIISALAAQTVRYIDAHDAEGRECGTPYAIDVHDVLSSGSMGGTVVECTILEAKRYELMSAALNLLIIGTYSLRQMTPATINVLGMRLTAGR